MFTELSFGEQFTLWAVRCWTEAARDGVCLHPLLKEAFSRVGVASAYLALNHMLCVLAAGAQRPIVIYSRNCVPISPDEILLLGLVGDLQENRAEVVPPIYSIHRRNLGILHHHRIPFPACIRSSKSSRTARRSTQKSLPCDSR